MKRFAVSTAALMLAATPLMADNHDAGDKIENAAEGAAANIENAAEGAATAAGNAAQDVANDAEAAAENAETMAENAAGLNDAELIRTRDITGGEVYTVAEGESWDAIDAIGDGWNDIGEIEDVVLSRDGQLKGIVAEVGGFLDIADKHVMLEVKDMKLVPVDDREYAIVTRMTEEELEQLPEVDEGFWE
ncbi:PRC-barrel domain-containing protein [Halovulum sp. GXIMD14794]